MDIMRLSDQERGMYAFTGRPPECIAILEILLLPGKSFAVFFTAYSKHCGLKCVILHGRSGLDTT
ncbi:hypothetical protein C1H46_000100 [Malus baccata]|uniref:Uncharacterized protein n=1 Tax=Malus baccata TaxID=106549 RepID=A0A540NT19_MALBA|nr:hypothetical protein C1H46_000100 [Malus baccata]